MLGASCAGVFVLGEAGLLNARRCTTTWWLHEALAQRFPKARAVWASGLVDDGRIVSIGGPMSWVDLALYTISQLLGPEAAAETANFAVIDNTPLTQAVYAPKRFIEQSSPFLLDAEQAVRAAGVGLTTIALGKTLGISERTLHRKLKAAAGESPKSFNTRIRLESAKALLSSPSSSIKRVAAQCGYEDEGSFRRAFNRFSGMTPAAYRDWAVKRGGATSIKPRLSIRNSVLGLRSLKVACLLLVSNGGH
jgi:transcriptional regulator GlxA family with amidase domain